MRSTNPIGLLAAGTFVVLSFLGHEAQAQTGSKLSKSEAKTVVDMHNKARSAVGVTTKLAWDNTIAAYAQKWADYLAKNSKFIHRPRSGSWKQKYGENLAGNSSVAKAIQSWLSEKKDYKGDAIGPKTPSKVWHYTQMIWDRSTKVGCGKAYDSKNKWWVIVCNYDPPGNVRGQKPISGKKPVAGGWRKWGEVKRTFDNKGRSVTAKLPLQKSRSYKAAVSTRTLVGSSLGIKVELIDPKGKAKVLRFDQLFGGPEVVNNRTVANGSTATYVFTPSTSGTYSLKFSVSSIKGKGGSLSVVIYQR